MSFSSPIAVLKGSWFDLNLDKLVILLLPILWRKPKMVAFLQALVVPIKLIHYDWKVMRINNLYRIRHNWMKCYLQAALNDEFDPSERRITIEEPEYYASEYIFTQAENRPRFLGTKYLRPSVGSSGSGYDFTVNFNGVHGDIYDIRALVDFYRIAGPRYNVINRGITVGEISNI